jgi:hypothetical protein
MKNELTTAETALNEGKTQLEGGKYMDAVNKLKVPKKPLLQLKLSWKTPLPK